MAPKNPEKKTAKKYRRYSMQECEQMRMKASKIDFELDSNPTSDNEEKKYDDDDSGDIRMVEGTRKELKLEPHQEVAVDKLKNIKSEKNIDPSLKPNQLLAFMQGIPGSGKTTTAKKLAEKLGLRAIFTGTTHTAAAQLRSDTINSLLGLGINKSVIPDKTILPARKDAIRAAFEDVDLLVIDEASMLTPVTLAKIDLYMRAALDEKYSFGGKDVILIGDMFQFPPIDDYLSKPALYQAAVALALGFKMPNEDYRVGASLFTKFRLVILEGLVRASPEFDEWLAQLRDLTVKYPITEEWLNKFNILSNKDFKARDIDWSETDIAVSGNPERFKFVATKMKEFGLKHGEPILRWKCPVRSAGKGKKYSWGEITFDPTNIYDELIRYFVRGAKCMLTESVDNTLGLGKGCEAVYLDVVWEDNAFDLNKLPRGEITDVTPPTYIVVGITVKEDADVVSEYVVSIPAKAGTFKDINGKPRSYKRHACQLSVACTFHKLQGKTLKSIILSLNSTKGISQKLKAITMSSIYVGASRVHCHDHLRILPLSGRDREALKKLTWDPDLRIWLSNYDEEGRWKPNGLLPAQKKKNEQIKLELALTD